MDENTFQKIRDSISNNKTDLALKLLKKYLKENESDNDYLNLVTIQESNFNSLKKRQMLGNIDSNEFNRGINNVNVNILNLLEGLSSGYKAEEAISPRQKPKKKNFEKKDKIILSILLAFILIIFSGFTNYPFFKLFNNHISDEDTKADLLGRIVCLQKDPCWIFLSKENFIEFDLIKEKIDGNNYEKTLNLKLEDVRNKKLYHMKLFLRYSYEFCFWDLDDDAVFEYYHLTD